LLESDRAIITPYPGTTRDYLKEKIKIRDSIFTLIDMAGIERPSHPVEKAGIKKAVSLARKADGVLLLLDSSRVETSEDLKLINKFKAKKTILLFNKMDLPLKMDREKINNAALKTPWIDVSALKGTNLDKLKKVIHKHFLPPIEKEQHIILHLRQKLILEEIMDCLERGARLLENGHSEEIYAEEIRRAAPLIGQLTGEIRSDEIIDDIFSRFCVGK